ncbi:MAG: tRNA (adenosine(37)-N6)-threonylcarbamoyltransferase complex dimerization subunit type 1 TsaB [Myxococcaceae bacterium]
MHSLWLILDTACPRALIALAQEDRVLAEVYLDEYKRHGERLAGAIENCLSQAGRRIQELGAVAVGVGPGSFIGVRIAMAHAKGLCTALQIPLFGFNTLAGIEGNGAILVAIDARRNEFYALKTGEEQAIILKSLPTNTYLETQGPVAQKVLPLLPKEITDQTLTLVPNYIRDSQC